MTQVDCLLMSREEPVGEIASSQPAMEVAPVKENVALFISCKPKLVVELDCRITLLWFYYSYEPYVCNAKQFGYVHQHI